MILPPEQLVVHARVHLGRGDDLPWAVAVDVVKAFEEALAEIRRLRDRVVVLEQERFE